MKKNSKHLLLMQFLLPYFAMFFVAIFLFTLFMQNVLLKNLKDQYMNGASTTLHQNMEMVSSSLRQGRDIQEYLMQDPDMMVDADLDDVLEVQSIMKNLRKYSIVNNNIRQIALYFVDHDYVLTASTTMPVELFHRLYQGGADLGREQAKSALADANDLQRFQYLQDQSNYVWTKYPLKVKNREAFLLLQIDLTYGLKMETGTSLGIYNNRQELIATQGQFPVKTRDRLSPLAKEQADRGTIQNIVKLDGVKYLASTEHQPLTDWTYCMIKPENLVFGQTQNMEWYYLFLVLGLTLVSLGFAWLSIQHNFRPVSQLAKIALELVPETEAHQPGDQAYAHIGYALETLAAQKKNIQMQNLTLQQDDYLRCLLRGQMHENEGSIENLGLEKMQNAAYGLLLIRVDLEENSFVETYLNSPECQTQIPGYICPTNFSDLTAYIACISPRLDYPKTVEYLFTELKIQFPKDIFVVANPLTKEVRDIAGQYRESLQTLDYQFVKGNQALIWCQDVAVIEQHHTNTPDQLFAKLEYHLLRGMGADIALDFQRLHEHFQEENMSLYYVKGVCYQLLMLTSGVRQSLQKEGKIQNFERVDMSYYSNLPTVDFFLQELEDYCLRLSLEVQKSNKAQNKNLANEMRKYIQDNCMTDSWSVQDMAGHFSMSISNLSQYYKAQFGVTISTTLTEVRMEKAREMLEHSKISVNEIAGMVGYQSPSSFIRKFKSFHGITPTQYIEKVQKKSGRDK